MQIFDPTTYHIIYWSGQIEANRLRLDTFLNNTDTDPFSYHSAMAANKQWNRLYCCTTENNFTVSEFRYSSDDVDGDKKCCKWEHVQDLACYDSYEKEALLQLKLDQHDRMLLGTSGKGFIIWDFGEENKVGNGAIYLPLPHGVRNISTKMMSSNSIMISSKLDYAVAGVRKNLYVWCLQTRQLIKILDAHFGRIIQLEALTIGNWNCAITSSIDRSVKVWNINNIFEQVHVIDRHELQIDHISLSETGLAVTVTRSCVGVWELRVGHLLSKLADSHLGAIVTHAEITPTGKYIVSSETGKLLIWNRVSEQVLFRDDQPGIQQVKFLENGDKVLAISCANINRKTEDAEGGDLIAVARVRSIPDGNLVCAFEYPFRMIPGIAFRNAVITSDNNHIVVVTIDKLNKDCISVFNMAGNHVHKIALKGYNIKEVLTVIPLPHKPTQIGVIGSEKGSIVDIKSKRHIRSIPKWNGSCTKDGKYGLYAPSRGGLEMLELRKGTTVKIFIPKVAEGVFTVICMFTEGDEYVLYYHSGKKTLRVFRTSNTDMIANYRMQAELTAIKSTTDGKGLVLGTVDGCLSVLSIADPESEDTFKFLAELPSRDEQWKKKLAKRKANIRFKATITLVLICLKFQKKMAGNGTHNDSVATGVKNKIENIENAD